MSNSAGTRTASASPTGWTKTTTHRPDAKRITTKQSATMGKFKITKNIKLTPTFSV